MSYLIKQIMDKVNIFWFRRDLRLEDDSGLHHAFDREEPVVEHTKARERALKVYRQAMAE